MDKKQSIEELLEPLPNQKTFKQLLQEGVRGKGGLEQLASAEQAALARSTVEPKKG